MRISKGCWRRSIRSTLRMARAMTMMFRMVKTWTQRIRNENMSRLKRKSLKEKMMALMKT